MAESFKNISSTVKIMRRGGRGREREEENDRGKETKRESEERKRE